MNVDIILNRFKQRFNEIPKENSRAKIGPRQFIIALIVGLSMKDKRQRSLEALRGNIMNFTGQQIAPRGSFWERMATGRLLHFLLLLVTESIKQMGAVSIDLGQMTSKL